ncbi:MAG: flagellar biosynthesis anti-sigma factor FlgM [Liquorilactobacillus sp.]|uniref:flagellar biosynthesis anti-sigma factor FlgM n=1 Tax=Liquorilactobacillus nagelii TaxID=82688 RepID=UPI0039ED313D
MKIEGNYSDNLKIDLTDSISQVKQSRVSYSEGPTAQVSNNVTLSTTAKKILKNEKNDGGFDSQKVDSLKKLISSGKYQISAEKIADGVLGEIKIQG